MNALPPGLRRMTWALALGFTAVVALEIFGVLGGATLRYHVSPLSIFEASYEAALGMGAWLCAERAIRVPGERLAWALMAFGLALWAGGDLYWALLTAWGEEVPTPSI